VRQRQVQIHREVAAELELVLVHACRGTEVSVRGDAPLGWPGRAGGVDDGRDVRRLHAREPALDDVARTLRAHPAQLGERDRAVRLALHEDDGGERRAAVPDTLDLRELLAVLTEDRDGLRVLEHVRALLGRVRRVDRHHRDAGGEDAVVRERPLGPCGAEDRDVVARRDSQLHEPAGDLADRGAELRVGDRIAPR
jgi:hypothetical protein